jgi:hypothetical protein
MTSIWRAAALALCFVFVVFAAGIGLHGVSAPAAARPHKPASLPSPSPSPTAPPTPSMTFDEIPNGTWLMILQPVGLPVYSDMTLKDDGTIVTGVWKYDPKTSYLLSGTRDGSHIKLDLKPAAKPDSAPIGSMDITIDTYADMFGSVTVGALTDMPFTAAQHSRIPPAVSDTPAPDESPYP